MRACRLCSRALHGVLHVALPGGRAGGRGRVGEARSEFDGVWAKRGNVGCFSTRAEMHGRLLELGNKQRKLGERSLLDVLASEAGLFNARGDAVAVGISTIEAAYRLLRVLGSLDQTSVFWQ